MKRVILIYPRLSIVTGALQAPLSIMALASPLEKAGYDPIIIDTRLNIDYRREIKDGLSDAVFVGISTMTGTQIKYALEIARAVREMNKEIPIVWGGIHPTETPTQTIRNEYVDVVIRGEGEETVVKLADAICEKKSFRNIKGITYKFGGNIYSNPARELLDFEYAPLPAWHLVSVVNYYDNIGIQTARGCPHRCSYCYNISFNHRKWRPKSAEKVLDEIEFMVRKYGIKKLHFLDDNFFVSQKRVTAICEGLLKRNLRITWDTDCRIDYFERFDDNFLGLIKRSGSKFVLVGAESGSQRILDLLQKDIMIPQIIEMARKCKSVNWVPRVAFMIGVPTETEQDRKLTYNLMDRMTSIYPGVTPTSLSIYTPTPNTPLLDVAKRWGFKEPQSLEEWSKHNYNECNLPWYTKREKIVLESISYIPRFVFWHKVLKSHFITPNLLPLYWVYRFFAKVRWKIRFFKFPWEYLLLKKFLNYKERKSIRKDKCHE